jgi:phosphatidylglycerophosphate synthase
MIKSVVSPAIARLEYRPLLRSALGAILAPTLVAVTVSPWAVRALALSDSFLPHLLGLLACGGVLVLYGLPAHGPHLSFGAANFVTVIRAALAAFLAALLLERADMHVQIVVLGAATAAAAMDALDGWLARRTRMASTFGARFDMETDALFILILSLWAWHLNKAGLWVIASGLLRYAFLLGITVLPALRAPLPESFRRKTVAALQMVALLLVICPWVPAPTSAVIAAAALSALSISFLLDTRWLLRHRTHPAGAAACTLPP